MADRLAGRLAVRQPAGRRSRSVVAIFAILAVLNGVGLTMVLSASAVTSLAENGSPWSQFAKQAGWFVLGIVALVAALRIDYRRRQQWASRIYLGAIALLLLVFVPGIGQLRNGARRWIGVGQFTILLEIAKLAVLLDQWPTRVPRLAHG